jgi:hypothetical protein
VHSHVHALRRCCKVLDFSTALAILFTVPVAVFVLPVEALPLLILALTLLLLYISRPRELVELVKRFALFVTPLATASLLFQIVIGLLDLYQLLTTLGRVYTLFVASAIAIKSFSAKELLSLARRLGFKAFLTLLLAIKLLKYSTQVLADVRTVYKANLGHVCGEKSFLCRARLTAVWVRAFAQLFTVKAFEVGEAMYTRYRAALRLRRGEQEAEEEGFRGSAKEPRLC